jgi:phage tail-like protein
VTINAQIPAFYVDAITLEATDRKLTLANRAPEPNEQGIARTASVVRLDLLTLTAGGTATDLARAEVYIAGVLAFRYLKVATGEPTGFFSPFNASLAEQHAWDAYRLALTFDFLYPWESEQLVTVRVLASLTDGTTLDESYSFRTVDETRPRVVSAASTGPKTVRVAFHEPIAEASAELAENYTLEAQIVGNVPAVALTVTAAARVDAKTVELTTNTEMSPAATYKVTVEDVEDVAGNVVAPPYDHASFEGYTSTNRPPTRAFDLWRMIPKINRQADTSGDLERFVRCLQDVVELVLAEVDRFPDFLDPATAPADSLPLHLAHLGNPFNLELLDEAQRRRLASNIVALYRQAGTAPGIVNALRLILGLEFTVRPCLSASVWRLDVSRLDDDAILGVSRTGRDRWTFDVISPSILTDGEEQIVREVVRIMKKAGTHLGRIVEPDPPSTPNHLVLGVSRLDAEWKLH